MKKFHTAVLGLAAGAALAFAATGADANGGRSIKDDGRAQPQRWFDGLYVGLHGGVGTGDHDRETIGGFKNSYDSYGGLLGGHVGFGVQMGPWVVGIEGDAAWTNIKGDDNSVGGTLDKSRFNYVASVRGRLGFAATLFNPNDFLIFGTAGWGFAQIEHTNTSVAGCCGDHNVDGFTYGGGAQLALSNVWSVRAEYRHYDLDTYSVPAPGGGLNPFKVDNALGTFTVGVTMCISGC